ncbi:MAG: trypsin-like serine protease [Phycisphaerales bacterium JB059]
MKVWRVAGVVLAGVLWMGGQSFADEASIRTYLAGAEATAYLQQDDTRLERIEAGKRDPAGAVVFQKFIGDLPLHGARVFVIENDDGSVAQVFDDSTENLRLRRGPVNIGADMAIDLAEATLPNAVDSAVEQVWFRLGDQAVLAWEVTTTLADGGMPASPTHFEAVIDAATGALLSERQIDTKSYAPGSPETADGVFPRIVINNTIGAQGARDYAAPFDAVIRVGGCTGTLIAPNVVLSARHCGIGSGDLVRFGDNSNSPTFTVTVQSSSLPDGSGSLLDGGDVAILVLTSSVPANVAEPMRLIDETDDLEGMLCATLGYGYNGLGSAGHGFTSDGFRWGGENIIDAYGSPASSSGSNIISTDFDNGTSGANTIPTSSQVPLEFEATTAPGDSGGPVLVQFGSEWVIAGVLSGGTTSTSVYGDISWWTGTAIYRSAIEAAGGQFVTGLEILFPDGLPDLVSSAGGDTLRVDIVPSPADPVVPGSGTFHVDTGSGFQQFPLTAGAPNSFTATFPASADCPANIEYFISFDLDSGATVTAPAGASSVFHVQAADQVDLDDLYDFETPVGFSAGAPGDDATTGIWVRVDPIGTAAQPEDDHTPSGTIAWVTGQGSPSGGLGDNDIDGGTTSLVSNAIDLSGTESATISYARWYSNSAGAAPNADIFQVFVSDDDGQNYVLVETVGPSGAGTSGGWIEAAFNVADFVDLTSTVRLKFVASDLGAGSVVEAAIDDVHVFGVSCADALCPADLAPPAGQIDFSDIVAFLAAFGAEDPAADFAMPIGTFDFSDVVAYLDAFAAGCP